MRLFMTINEANPLEPFGELHVNGYRMRVTEHEMRCLASELQWAIDAVSDPTMFADDILKYERIANETE